jgi:ABC-type multidrug transport system ATPase subunit
MIALENVYSRIGDEILFSNLNNSFEIGRVHGIWNEKDKVNTWLLKLLAGHVPLDSGIIRYRGVRLDHTDVAYYGRGCVSGTGIIKGPVLYKHESKLIYLFDNIFDRTDRRSFVRMYDMILSLKDMGRTILVTSSDHRVLIAATDFFHILSKGVFQAKVHFRQYDLLEDVLSHVQRS